jgi:alpha-ketoglutarate-dependent taurine dioxygenase
VPGAAASLVQTAASAELVNAAEHPDQAPAAATLAPALVPAPWPTDAQAAPAVPAWASVEAAVAPSEGPEAAVTLGFADGASIELAADDPRVRTFRAAAAALLDAPHR